MSVVHQAEATATEVSMLKNKVDDTLDEVSVVNERFCFYFIIYWTLYLLDPLFI